MLDLKAKIIKNTALQKEAVFLGKDLTQIISNSIDFPQ